MKFEKDFEVDEIEDTAVDKAGSSDVRRKRKVKLSSKLVSVTVSGSTECLLEFETGESVQVRISSPQTSLSDLEEEEGE